MKLLENSLFPCDLTDVRCMFYLVMSLLEGHREFSSLWLPREGSAEDFGPGFILLSLRQWEWRHTAFGIHLDQYLTQILTNWVLASLRLS